MKFGQEMDVIEAMELFQTTDADFKHTIHKEAMSIFYKLAGMKSLAVHFKPQANEQRAETAHYNEILLGPLAWRR